MTIQQLYFVLEVARTGSVNRTAKELFVSQPAISVSIRKLEEELGFSVFVRSSSGVKLTQKGQRLVDEASNIISSIERIGASEEQRSPAVSSAVFRLVHMNYLPSYRAFLRLCREYEDSSFFQFSFLGMGGEFAYREGAVDLVSRNACDCLAWLGEASKPFLDRCKKMKVRFVKIGVPPMFLNLAENHPALEEGIPGYAEEIMPKLKQYPYVSYNHAEVDLFPQENLWGYINSDKLIHFSSMALRTDVVANTHGFSISMQHKFPDKGVVAIPFCSYDPLTVGLLYSEVRGLGLIGERYLELLRDEMAFLG